LSKVAPSLPLGERVGVRGKQDTPDSLQNTLNVTEYLVIPESEYLIPFSTKPFITNLIAWIESMLPAIHFHNNPLFEVYKVHNIPAHGLLTTKLDTFYLSVSKVPP
jgi:hypothetical protein